MEGMEEYKIPPEVMEMVKDPDILRKQVEEGKTLQEIFSFDDKTMLKFYLAAKSLFDRQEWKKAADAFMFLTSLNPYVSTYWLGLGMSEQLREEFHASLLAYAMAILTDIENPLPHYHSAKCYLALGEKHNAIQSFEMAIQCSKSKPEYAFLLNLSVDAVKKIKEGQQE
jgi:type III secretion system low calcium response chaperone LcrH/SycD